MTDYHYLTDDKYPIMGYVGAMDLKCCCCEPEEWKMWSNDVVTGVYHPSPVQEITELRSFIRAIAEALGTEAQGRDLIEVASSLRQLAEAHRIRRENAILEAKRRALNVK